MTMRMISPILALLVLLGWTIWNIGLDVPTHPEDYPRLAIYSTSQTLNEKVVPKYARFDMVVVDYENWTNNPESIQMLRQMNKKMWILAYGNPIEVYYKPISKRPLNLQLSLMMEKDKYQGWWLMTDKGEHAVFYTPLPYWMMNMTTLAPKIDGQRWNQYIAHFYIDHALKMNPRPDGFFGDNASDNFHWLNNHTLKSRKLGFLDANLDGLPDEQARFDPAWREGMEEFYSIIRAEMGDDFLILGNKGNMELMNVLDGKMFEEFPFAYGGPDKRAGGWYQCMDSYLQMGNNAIVQVKNHFDKQHLIFVLTSTLLGDGYFAVGHNYSSWLPEFNSIGKPLGPYSIDNANDIWSREFEKATVRVYPEKRRGEIIYK